MTDEAIALFTRKSVETIRKDGGTQSWVLDRGHARQCRYVVLCCNAHSDRSEGDGPHGAAFLAGRIASLLALWAITEIAARW